MVDYKLKECIDKLDTLDDDEKISMIWQWSKQNHINLRQFNSLIDHVVSKTKRASKLSKWHVKNFAGEEFTFFINEKNEPRLDVKHKEKLLASLIMTSEEFTEFIHSLIEINENIKMHQPTQN